MRFSHVWINDNKTKSQNMPPQLCVALTNRQSSQPCTRQTGPAARQTASTGGSGSWWAKGWRGGEKRGASTRASGAWRVKRGKRSECRWRSKRGQTGWQGKNGVCVLGGDLAEQGKCRGGGSMPCLFGVLVYTPVPWGLPGDQQRLPEAPLLQTLNPQP